MNKTNRILEMVYHYGKVPKPASLLGPGGAPAEWQVTMLTGIFPNLERFNHRKRFRFWGPKSALVVGENVCWTNVKWGAFHVDQQEDALLIDYHLTANGFLTGRIRDLVRTTPDPTMLIGKFHLMWRGVPRFLGFFTLTRI